MGAHFSGQAAENTINKMLASPYKEANILGVLALSEILKVAPNFFQNIDYSFGETARRYKALCRLCSNNVLLETVKSLRTNNNEKYPNVSKLINFDSDADIKLASQILYTSNTRCLSKEEILNWCRKIKEEDIKKTVVNNTHLRGGGSFHLEGGNNFSLTLLKIILGSVPNRNAKGITRRQKLPRVFEQVFAEVEFFTDIGTYKDLQRNRMSSTERQTISADDLFIPEEYKDKKNSGILNDYLFLAEKTKSLNKQMSGIKKFRYTSEYATILGNKIRFNVKANLRQWVFFSELRTISGGHPTYRFAMQESARQIIEKLPFMKPLFTHVDWTPDYGLGRLKAEIATQERLSKMK